MVISYCLSRVVFTSWDSCTYQYHRHTILDSISTLIKEKDTYFYLLTQRYTSRFTDTVMRLTFCAQTTIVDNIIRWQEVVSYHRHYNASISIVETLGNLRLSGFRRGWRAHCHFDVHKKHLMIAMFDVDDSLMISTCHHLPEASSHLMLT